MMFTRAPEDPASRFDRGFEAAFSPSSEHVPRMRNVAATAAHSWYGPGPLLDDLALIVSELVTNAIEHGQGAACLRVLAGGDELRVEVTDASPSPARLQAPAAGEVSGRGLVIVAALARAWGVTDDGHTTWAALPAPTVREAEAA